MFTLLNVILSYIFISVTATVIESVHREVNTLKNRRDICNMDVCTMYLLIKKGCSSFAESGDDVRPKFFVACLNILNSDIL